MAMETFTIGVPKEGEPFPGIFERRVALTPAGIRDAVELGAKVFVEKEAGDGAGFTDLEYTVAGAQMVYSHEEVFRKANLLLKIGPLKVEEAQFFSPGTLLFGFMQLAIAPDVVLQTIQERQLHVVGYEVIETPQKIKPLLRISSEIAGKLAPQIASQLLESPPGLGILLAGIPGIPPADVVILGAGVLGTYAALSFLGVGASVYVLDFDREKLERLYTMSGGRVVTAISTQENIEKFVSFADVLISAVLIPGEAAPLLVRQETVAKMRRGSVIIDFAIDHGGSVETTRNKGPQPTPYVEENVIHFAVPNVPSRVPRTASHALTHAALPYLRQLLTRGWPSVLESEPALCEGLYFFQGQCVSHHLQGRCTVHPWRKL